MYKDGRYINAGTNEYYRWGARAQEKLARGLNESDGGFYSIPVDGGKYWTFGTSEGRYGEYIKYKDTYFSVNKGGYAYAKAGSEKGPLFRQMITDLLEEMKTRAEGGDYDDDDD